MAASKMEVDEVEALLDNAMQNPQQQQTLFVQQEQGQPQTLTSPVVESPKLDKDRDKSRDKSRERHRHGHSSSRHHSHSHR